MYPSGTNCYELVRIGRVAWLVEEPFIAESHKVIWVDGFDILYQASAICGLINLCVTDRRHFSRPIGDHRDFTTISASGIAIYGYSKAYLSTRCTWVH
jgi:hypothetical protein